VKAELVNRLKPRRLPDGSLFAMAAMLAISVIAGQAGHAATLPRAAKPLVGNAVRGQSLYQSCTGCHSLDENEVGPKHRGVVGRRAGTVPGYVYSAALKKSNIVWDKPALDRWLAGPQKAVPGSKMFFTVSNPQSRADIIAYLAQQR
jgi:cytochrome c